MAVCLLLLIGAGAGALGGYHVAQTRAAKESAAAEPAQTAVPATVESRRGRQRVQHRSPAQ